MAKQTIFQYGISTEVVLKIMDVLDSRHLPTKTLQTFLQKQIPVTMKILSVMVCNAKV